MSIVRILTLSSIASNLINELTKLLFKVKLTCRGCLGVGNDSAKRKSLMSESDE